MISLSMSMSLNRSGWMCFASQSRQRGVSEAGGNHLYIPRGNLNILFVLCRFQIAPVVALDLVSVKVLRDVGAKVRDEDDVRIPGIDLFHVDRFSSLYAGGDVL